MTADDRLRDAFRDLTDRVARDIDPARWDPEAGRAPAQRIDARSSSTRTRAPRWPAIAVAAVALIIAGGLALALTRDGDGGDIATGPATETAPDVSTDTTDGGPTAATTDPATTDVAASDAAAPHADVRPEARLRVITELVLADADDPFLNVRFDPDPRADLLAKLPATYTGLAATGRTETAPDGGEWIEVNLIDPVSVATVERETGRPPSGWVNAAFVEELPEWLPVTTDEVPPCTGGVEPVNTGGGLRDGYVYALGAAEVGDDCLRVVVTFGEGRAPFEWFDLPSDTGPADGLPDVLVTMSGAQGATLDLGPVETAWPGATGDGGMFVVRQTDRSLDLLTTHHVEGVTITGLPERGVAVIDLLLGSELPPPGGAGVFLTAPLTVGAGSVEAVGIARPFEATLGVAIEDGDGNPVEAVYSGSDFLGTITATEYGVGTTDWLEAWGSFAVRAEALAAGDYTLVLDAQGGADDPETLRIPFTVEDGGDGPALASATEQAAARALIDFARGGPVDQVPLADEVTLYLGAEPYAMATPSQLADRDAWAADVEAGFGGFAGPFNPLDQLRRTGLRFTAGPVPHCAGPPLDWPEALDGLRQVNIEPTGIDSCIQWFGVHLFLDDDDRIAAVSLDLFGP